MVGMGIGIDPLRGTGEDTPRGVQFGKSQDFYAIVVGVIGHHPSIPSTGLRAGTAWSILIIVSWGELGGGGMDFLIMDLP